MPRNSSTKTCKKCRHSLPKSSFDLTTVVDRGVVRERPFDYCRSCRDSIQETKNALLPPNPAGLCFCGCGKVTPLASFTMKSRGWVAGEHIQFIHNHHGRKAFRYEVDPATGCWNWIGRTVEGYGSFRRDGSHYRAHVVAFERAYGPVPEGVHVHHTCENKRCVNPDHLEALTHSEHSTHHARMQHSPFTEEDVRRIRSLKDTMPLSAIASEYSVSYVTIWKLVYRRTWRDID